MKMRKILAVLTAVLMLCTIIPMGALSVSAATAVYSEDFEDGTTAGWATGSTIALAPTAAADLPVANANGGNYALYFESSYYSYMNKEITVEKNTTYLVTLSILSGKSGNPVNVRIRTDSTDVALNAYTPSTAGWETYSFTFDSGNYTTLNFRIQAAWETSIFYVDNLSVVPFSADDFGGTDGYIYNGDFETGSSAPWNVGVNAEVVADPTGSGRGYVMKADEATSGAALFSQTATNLKANTYYKLSFKVYCYNTYSDNAFWVRFPSTVTDWSVDLTGASGMNSASANNYTPRINVLGKTGAWYDIAITFNTGELTEVLINFMNYRVNHGQYYFDNIKIREMKDPSFDGYITNGDFETGDLTGWTVGAASIAEENGNAILQGTATKKYGNFVHQIVTVEPNTDYAVSFKVKAAVSGGIARVYAGTGTGNTGYKNSTYSWTPKTDVWTTYTISFNSGSDTQIYVNLCQGLDNGGDIYYDDVLMWEVKPASFDGYITNGDFETGVPNNWKFSQSTAGVAAEAAYEGNFGANLLGNGGWGGLMSTSITTEAGKDYKLSFWYKAISRGVNFTVRDTDNSGTKLTSGYYSKTDWTYVELEFTALSGTTYLNFNGPGEDASYDDEQVYIDNLTVVLVESCAHAYDNACDVNCNLCGETREVAGHSYYATIPEAPTCTEAGVTLYTCSNCGSMYSEPIAALGHTPGAEADCDSAQVCETCGIELAPALGHTAGAEADCDSAQVCETCGIELAPALGHTAGAEADCENAQVCTVCGIELAPAIGHNYVGEQTQAPTCGDAGVMTYTCQNCGDSYTEAIAATGEHSYFYPCDVVCQVCYQETNPDAAHNVVHVEAVAPTCTALGNVEYWYCSDCGAAWLDEACTQVTNPMSVKLPMAEHEYFYPCDPVCMNCYEITNPDAAHAIVAVEAVEATCTENGNIAYWYCSDCGAAWADEALTQVTNRFSVVVPAAGEHTYADEYDVDCDVCGAVREVELPIVSGGTSASEDVRGVAAKFALTVEGMGIDVTTAVYDNAYVGEYKLISMGAIADNGVSNKEIPAVYLCDDEVETSAQYAIRVINIPEGKENVEITFTPYFVIEIDGVATTIYGEAVTATYGAVLG